MGLGGNMGGTGEPKVEHQVIMTPLLWFLAIFNCFIAAIFVLYEFVLRVLPSSMTSELIDAFHTNGTGIGWFSAAFLMAYAIMQIPVGVIMDKFSARVVLTIAVSACAVGSVALAYAHHLPLAFISRFVIGIGAGFAIVGVYFLIGHWFPRKYYPFMTGMVQFMAGMGAILGQVPIAMLLNNYSWRNISLALAVIGAVMAVIYAVFLRSYPRNHQHCHKKQSVSMIRCVIEVIRKPRNWLVSSQALFTWGPMSAVASLWGIPYLEKAYNINGTEASSYVAACWIGMAVGSPILGVVARYVRSSLILIASPLLGLIVTLIFLYSPVILTPLAIIIVLFLYGFAAGIIPISFFQAVSANPKHLVGTVTGFVNTVLILGGAFFQPLVGWILSFETPPTHGNDYSVFAFEIALIIIPASWLISTILGFLIYITERK